CPAGCLPLLQRHGAACQRSSKRESKKHRDHYGSHGDPVYSPCAGMARGTLDSPGQWNVGRRQELTFCGEGATRAHQKSARGYGWPRNPASRIGGAEGARTPDPKTASLVLSQLSYSPTRGPRLPSASEVVKIGQQLARGRGRRGRDPDPPPCLRDAV